MNSRRLSFAVTSGLLCIGLPLEVSAAEPSAPTKVAVVQQPVGVAGPASPADAPSADAKAPEVFEDAWLPWDTGEEFAGMGFALFGHLGAGNRFNDGPVPSGTPTGVEADINRNGLRVGLTAIFRPIRWFGFGVGYEHADLNRDRVDWSDSSGSPNFQTTYRDLNILWIDARAYPLRIDPFALYINIAGGPAWQGLSKDSTLSGANGQETVSSTCTGSGSAGMAMKAAVGAELALLSGALLWGEFGPDYNLLSEDSLDGCDVGAGNAAMIGFRAGFAIGFEKSKKLQKSEEPVKPKDDDLDTIVNDQDACPTVAGVPNADPAKNGCPPPKDQDADGIIDEQDACPTVVGVASTDPTKNGCPLPQDKDNDTIVDEVDACPDIPGVKSDDPKLNGCPGDTDGDGFRDDQDGCPQEKGVDDPDPQKRGCPKLVRVTETEIIILEQVQFDTGKATIKAVSDPLLDSVGAVMKEHPEIIKIEVQGHTDNKGAAALNKKLSQDRADSVMKALIKRGVEKERFVAKGFGQDQPIADNKTDDGRQKNRRVQFKVIEKRAKGALPGAAVPIVPSSTPATTAVPPTTAPGATPPGAVAPVAPTKPAPKP